MTTGEYQALATAIEKLVTQGEVAEQTNSLVVDAEVNESGARAKRERNWDRWLKIVTLVAAIAAGGGGFSAYRTYTAPPPPEIVPATVQATVVDEAKALTSDVQENDRKIRKLGGAVIKLQEQQAETVEYLGDKLDAISSKAKAVKVDDYPQLKAAKERRDEKKSDDRVEELFEK